VSFINLSILTIIIFLILEHVKGSSTGGRRMC